MSLMLDRSRRKSGTAGAAAVELALVLPFMVALFVGVADFSLAYHEYLQLDSVLGSAGQYAFIKGQSETGSTLTSDVTSMINTTSPITLTTVTVTYNNGDTSATNCYCVSGSPATYSGPVTCGSSCSDGATAGKFVALTGAFKYSPLFIADQVFFGSSIAQTVTVRLK